LKSQGSSSENESSHALADLGETLSSLEVNEADKPVKLTILADTSYGSCCVDEIAAEHVEADAVIHYGRACLSPTARLPVVYIFTKQELDAQYVVKAFRDTFPDFQEKVIVTADVTYSSKVYEICSILMQAGYKNTFASSIIHNPSSLIPNRTIPDPVKADSTAIAEWQLFHISEPPTSLLLTLSTRVSKIYIYPTDQAPTSSSKSLLVSTSLILRRRYALVTSLATVGMWGILINTLSVKNYLHIVDHVKSRIAAAGKKSYLFVVGKLNAAKIANFSEIGGWVVIGCWESSLVDSKDFYKPVITPFELDLALKRDEDRVWTGEWRGDFQGILDNVEEASVRSSETQNRLGFDRESEEEMETGDYDSEDESAPPEFDLRTGQYVSQSRPMHRQQAPIDRGGALNSITTSTALTKRARGDIVAVNGVASPAADFLKLQRTWQGLGSDFEVKYDEEEIGSTIEEGRTGVARGYTVGDSARN